MHKRKKPTFLSPEEEKKQDDYYLQQLRMDAEARQIHEERKEAKREEQKVDDEVIKEQHRLERELSYMECGLKCQYTKARNKLQEDISDSQRDDLEKKLKNYEERIDHITKDKRYITGKINASYFINDKPVERHKSKQLWNILINKK